MIKSENFPYEALDASPDGIYVYDVKQRKLVFVNRQFSLMTGYNLDRTATKNENSFFEMFHPDDRSAIVEHLENIGDTSDEEPVEFEFRLHTVDGKRLSCLSRCRIFDCGRDGAVSRIIGTLVDITERARAEQDLSKKHERLSWALEKVGIGTWLNELPLIELHWDKQTRRLFFVSPDEKATIDLFWSRLHPEDREPTRLAMEKSIREGSIYEIDHRAVSPDKGTIRWIRSIGRASYGADGTPKRFDGVNFDITEHKRVEMKLRESERKFRFLIDSVPHMIWVTRPDGSTEYCNRRALDYIGCNLDQIEGWKWKECIHPDDRPKVFEAWRKAVATGSDYRIEERILNGATSQYRWFMAQAVPQRDQRGRVVRWYGTCTDIQEIKLAEKALRESEARFRLVVENSWDGIHQLDLTTGLYVFMSPSQERLTGFKSEELMLSMEEAEQRLHPDDREKVNQYLDRVVAGATPEKAVEYRWRVKNGEYRWFGDSRRAIFDETGKAVSLVGVSRDITETKKYQQELEKSKKQLENKIAERTKLAELRSKQLQSLAVELIEAEERERRRISQMLHDDLQQVIAAAGYHLENAIFGKISKPSLETVQGLLKEAMAKSRRMSHELSPAVLKHSGIFEAIEWLCGEMKEQFGLQIEMVKKISRRLESETLKLFLFRAVQELLFNVVKHSGEKSARVEIFDDNNCLYIEVSDHGRGFDPGFLDTTTIVTGIGLLSMRERARYLGGALAIESIPGDGARFTLSVPLSLAYELNSDRKPDPKSDRETRAGDLHGHGGENRPIRVMFVDDHDVVRKGLIELIAGQPDIYLAGEAADGKQALDRAKGIEPDVILMDVSMPEMSGKEATHLIKDELPGVKVIGLSMFEDETVASEMRKAGADDFLTKTATAAELLEAIYGVMKKESPS